jgi:hypothetical protein
MTAQKRDNQETPIDSKNFDLKSPDRKKPKEKSHPVIIALSILIPLIILGIILYLNYLPFGYNKTFVIDVGSVKDTTGTFYLEQSPALGARQSFENQTFRAVDGVVNAVYAPKPILKNVTITAEVVGDNVYFIKQPSIDFKWDYDFMNETMEVVAPHTTYSQFLSGDEVNASYIRYKQFAVLVTYNSTTKNTLLKGDIGLVQDSKQIILNFSNNGTQKQIKYALPDFYIGKAHSILVGYNKADIYLFVDGTFVAKSAADDAMITNITLQEGNSIIYSNYADEITEKIARDENGCYIFDGKTRLIYPNSQDMFEDGPFAVYVEWTPQSMNDSQQLIGHYNWEVWQNANNTRFQIGRVYNHGPFYATIYNTNADFFNHTHSLLGIYNPSANDDGYMELYIDNAFVGRTELGNDTIWKNYGTHDLSMGFSIHANSNYYLGTICATKFSYKNLTLQQSKNETVKISEIKSNIKIPLYGKGIVNRIKIFVTKN